MRPETFGLCFSPVPEDAHTSSVETIEGDVGPELYRELLAAFLDHLPDQLADILDAAEIADVRAARYVAHQIKGAALNFGAVRLDQLADLLLKLGPDEGELIQPIAHEISDEINRLREQNHCAHEAHTGPTIEDEVGSEVYAALLAQFLDQLTDQLGHLRDAADIGDVRAARYVAHQLKGMALNFGAVRLDRLAGVILTFGEDQGADLEAVVDDIAEEITRLQSALPRPA